MTLTQGRSNSSRKATYARRNLWCSAYKKKSRCCATCNEIERPGTIKQSKQSSFKGSNLFTRRTGFLLARRDVINSAGYFCKQLKESVSQMVTRLAREKGRVTRESQWRQSQRQGALVGRQGKHGRSLLAEGQGNDHLVRCLWQVKHKKDWKKKQRKIHSVRPKFFGSYFGHEEFQPLRHMEDSARASLSLLQLIMNKRAIKQSTMAKCSRTYDCIPHNVGRAAWNSESPTPLSPTQKGKLRRYQVQSSCPAFFPGRSQPVSSSKTATEPTSNPVHSCKPESCKHGHYRITNISVKTLTISIRPVNLIGELTVIFGASHAWGTTTNELAATGWSEPYIHYIHRRIQRTHPRPVIIKEL